MSKQSSRVVELPGAPVATPTEAEPVAAVEQPAAVDVAPQPSAAQIAAAAAAQAAMSQQAAHDQAMRDTAKLVGSGEAINHSHLNSRIAVLTNTRPPDEKLPRASDIDPSTIPYGRSVLTREGWVCSTRADTRIQPK